MIMEREQNDVNVIIPTFNGGDYLPSLLNSLVRQSTDEFSVIISDNGSSDDTIDVANQYHEVLDLEVIDSHHKKGKAFALNQAIRQSTAARFLFIDQDDTVNTDYVEAMVCKLIEYPYVAAMMDVGILNDCLRTYPRNIPRDQKFGQFAINIASGGTLGVRREVFDDIGLFDESFNFSTNDVEFCCRAYYAGYKLELVDEAVLNYRLRRTARDNFIQGLYYGRGNFAIAQRYPEIRGDQRNGVGRLVIDAGSIMCSLLSHYESRNKSAHDLGKVLWQLGCRCTQVFNNI